MKDLPRNVSIEEIMEQMLFIAKIEKGLRQADAGQTISHDRIKAKMAKWLK